LIRGNGRKGVSSLCDYGDRIGVERALGLLFHALPLSFEVWPGLLLSLSPLVLDL
jgi:hypothetical protein